MFPEVKGLFLGRPSIRITRIYGFYTGVLPVFIEITKCPQRGCLFFARSGEDPCLGIRAFDCLMYSLKAYEALVHFHKEKYAIDVIRHDSRCRAKKLNCSEGRGCSEGLGFRVHRNNVMLCQRNTCLHGLLQK